MERVLIIGLGRAGQRHVALARSHGLVTTTLDPDVRRKADLIRFNQIQEKFPYIVIATPPANHIGLAQLARELGCRAMLLEKPVCSLNERDIARAWQLAAADPAIMVAFNWRFHPQLEAGMLKGASFKLRSRRQRTSWPDWGLYLDHLVHGIDLATWLSATEVSEASWLKIEGRLSGDGRRARIQMALRLTGKKTAIIDDQVDTRRMRNSTRILSNRMRVRLAIDDAMFQRMWKSFLDWNGIGPAPVSLEDGIRAVEVLREGQKLLEEVV